MVFFVERSHGTVRIISARSATRAERRASRAERRFTAPGGAVEQVRVDPAKPATVELAGLEEMQDLILLGGRRLRESPEQGKNGRSIAQVAAGQLAQDEHAACDPFLFEELSERRVAVPKMVHSDR